MSHRSQSDASQHTDDTDDPSAPPSERQLLATDSSDGDIANNSIRPPSLADVVRTTPTPLDWETLPLDSIAAKLPQTESDVSSPLSCPSPEGGEKGRRCCLSRLPPWKVLVTLAACVMAEVSLGVTYTAANMTPYMTSYLRNVTGETTLDYGQTLWIINGLWLTSSVAMPFLGLIEKRMSTRLFFLIGIAINAVSFFGTYGAVQLSFEAVVIVYGFVQGITQSMLNPVCLTIAIQSFPMRKGLIAGITYAGYGGGSFIWNQVVTLWINPDNLQPDLTEGNDVYFTQSELLDRVPSCFLVLGGILAALQLVCFFAMTFPDKETAHTEDSEREMQNLDDAVPKSGEPELSHTGDESNSREEYRCIENTHSKHAGTSVNTTEGPTDAQSLDYGPLDVLKSRATWTLWFSYLSCDFAFLFVISFYKTYGQTFIRDDHLLSLVSSCSAIFNALGRPVWGAVADRIGYLPTLLMIQAMLCATAATFITCELADSPAMFFIWVCLIFFAVSGIYALQGPIVFSLFGSKYFIFSLGVTLTTWIVSTLTSTPLAGFVLKTFGYSGLFFSGAAGALIGLIILSSFLLNCGHPIPEQQRSAVLGPCGKRLACVPCLRQ